MQPTTRFDRRPDAAADAAAKKGGIPRTPGTGIITGAADDDPPAIGTYASAGAKFGPAFLWIAPVLLPMMFVVTYLSAKLGGVGAGAGARWLFALGVVGVGFLAVPVMATGLVISWFL